MTFRQAVLRLGLCVGIASGLFLSERSADAQLRTAPLLIEVDVSSSNNRTGGPIPLRLNINYFGTKAGLQGKLFCQLKTQSEERLVATYLFENLYLAQGQQVYEFLIQPPSLAEHDDGYDLHPIFIADDGQVFAFPDQEQLLRLPGATRRACVITVASPGDEILTDHEKDVLLEFALERYLPNPNARRSSERPVVTISRPVNVQHFPQNPLEHCTSDLVLLTGETFQRLNERQGTALLAWVRAGGSVGLFLSSTNTYRTAQLELLNRLTGGTANHPHLLLRDGTLQIVETPANATVENDAAATSLLLGECGLGRTALCVSPEAALSGSQWTPLQQRKMHAHLWKIRHELLAEQLDISRPNLSFETNTDPLFNTGSGRQRNNVPGYLGEVRSYRASPIPGGAKLLQETLPVGMRMLSLWVMVGLLGLFVVVIGPLDYLVLRTLKLQKFTWLTFPVMSILFTWGAIVFANASMRGQDNGGRVVIRDVSTEGLILRENEIATLMPVTTTEQAFRAERELIIPLDPSRLSTGQSFDPRMQERYTAKRPPVYRGRFPVEAELVQQVYKWTPEMVRRLRIPQEPLHDASGFDWSRPIDITDYNSHVELRQRIQSTFGEQAHAYLIRRNGRDDRPWNKAAGTDEAFDRIVLCGDPQLFVSEYDFYELGIPNNPGFSSRYLSPSFLFESAIREQGTFALVSRLAPKCDDFLEDLPILDSSQPDAGMLLIVVQRGNQWEIHRMLFRNSRKS